MEEETGAGTATETGMTTEAAMKDTETMDMYHWQKVVEFIQEAFREGWRNNPHGRWWF